MEAGSYLLNYAGCSQCKALGVIAVTNRVNHKNEEEEEEEEEMITYERMFQLLHCKATSHALVTTDECPECGHTIAKHKYTFTADNEFQVCMFM